MCNRKRRFIESESNSSHSNMETMHVMSKQPKNFTAPSLSDAATSASAPTATATTQSTSSSNNKKSWSMIMAKTFFPALSRSSSKSSLPSAATISDDDDTDETHHEDQDDHNEDQDDEDIHPDLLQVMHAKYATPQDQDVAVFLQLTQQLSLQSTLFLLQGHARALNLEQLQQNQAESLKLLGLNQASNKAVAAASAAASNESTLPSKRKKLKQFRFAEIANQKVRTVVHNYDYGSDDCHVYEDDEDESEEGEEDSNAEASSSTLSSAATPTSISSDASAASPPTSIKPTDAEKDLMWWSLDDLKQFRAEAIETVHYFKRYRPDYVQLVETVAACSSSNSSSLQQQNVSTKTTSIAAGQDASSTSPSTTSCTTQQPSTSSPPSSSPLSALEQLQEQLLQNAMKRLVQDSYARGLEIHICSQLGRRRKETVQAVLEEQQDCWASSDSYETTSHCLREQSLAYSQWSSRFALKMAECDTIDALQAAMSRWQATDQERMEM
ncbi:hypothetical protein MPSEU_000875300 [Mayamaea pseudoterrestris]|nr:hypothetical protein MPSEU_000875300 [Mayamaea pseudoterrestris]